MNADDAVVREVARRLDAARRGARAVQPSADWPDLTVEQAYRVQATAFDLGLAGGEREVGLKLGFTSEAKMRQMGIDELIVGRLADATQVPDGGVLRLATFIHPRIEPEVAFLVGRDVDLADPDADIEAAVSGVAAGLEVIDSRFEGFRFDLPRVIADNTSAAAFVVGPWRDPAEVDAADLAVELTHEGEPVAVGSTAAILGHPLRTLPRLAALGRRLGLALPAGSVVLAGAATAAVPLSAGEFAVAVDLLGTASLRVQGDGDE